MIALAGSAGAAAAAAQRPGVGFAPSTRVGAYHGVACPTSKACVAVGTDFGLNGASAIISTATGKVRVWSGVLTNDEMDAVACARSSATCIGMSQGSNIVATVNTSTGAMKAHDVTGPKGSSFALAGIACASATSCYAVGQANNSKASVVHLSGAGKELGVVTGTGSNISAIACPSTTLCLMVDTFKAEEIQLLKGGHLSTTHALPANTAIQQIACYQGKLCYGLGGSTSDLAAINELFPINPKTGVVGKALKIAGFNGMNLACASTAKCFVIGGNLSQTQPSPRLVTVTNGRAGKPTQLGSSKDALNDVACATTTVCYVVGTVQGLAGFVIKA